MSKNYVVMKVAGGSNVHSLAGAIAYSIRETGDGVELRAIGAGSVSQAVKGAAIARGHLAQNGYDLVIRPGFSSGEIAGEERTVMSMFLDKA